MDEDAPLNAYEAACSMLVLGAMPVIVPTEDGLHVVSLAASTARSLTFMFNDDVQVRLQFVTQAIVAVHESIEA